GLMGVLDLIEQRPEDLPPGHVPDPHLVGGGLMTVEGQKAEAVGTESRDGLAVGVVGARDLEKMRQTHRNEGGAALLVRVQDTPAVRAEVESVAPAGLLPERRESPAFVVPEGAVAPPHPDQRRAVRTELG